MPGTTHPTLPLCTYALSLLLLMVSAGTGCDRKANHAAAEPTALPVATFEVELLDAYEIGRVFSGIVRSRRSAALGFERGGLVAEMFVEEGDAVKAGQTIAQLDTKQLRAARKRIVAGVSEAQAGVGISTLTAERLGQLADEEFISRQSADEAKFGLQAAEAKQSELQAALAQIDVDLRKSRLVAPFSGVVSSRLVDEGTVVAAGAPVVRFRESELKEVVIGVPASVSISVGAERQLELGDQHVVAPVTAIVDDIDARTRTVSVILQLPPEVVAADGEVVRLIDRRRVLGAGFWIPSTALTQGARGLWTVYSVQDEGKASVVRLEAVEVLHAETDRAFVRGTLEPGDAIIATGLNRVVPGQRVTPTPWSPEPSPEAAP